MQCLDDTIKDNLPCLNNECRYHIEFAADLNCCHVAIIKHGNMKLQDIGDRLHITAARVKQLEQEILKKMQKKSKLLNIIYE